MWLTIIFVGHPRLTQLMSEAHSPQSYWYPSFLCQGRTSCFLSQCAIRYVLTTTALCILEPQVPLSYHIVSYKTTSLNRRTEFNEEQRNVFCVFSGEGVHRFRDYMNSEALNGDNLPDLGDDVTMYDDGLPDDEGGNPEDDGISSSLQDMGIDGAEDEGFEGPFASPFLER